MAQLQSSYSTTGQLERATGLPVVGSISLGMTREQRLDHWKQLKWFAGATVGLAAVLLVLLALEYMKRGMVA